MTFFLLDWYTIEKKQKETGLLGLEKPAETESAPVKNKINAFNEKLRNINLMIGNKGTVWI